jgi:1-phosphofructokinase family hexose kinase
MKRIITVTPNPAVDVTYTVKGVSIGGSHRVEAPLVRAGGKGVNVARVAHQLNVPVLAIATAGGASGAAFAAELQASALPHRLVSTAVDTRRSIALVDTVNGETSIFNEHGRALEPAEWLALKRAVRESLSAGDVSSPGVLVGSGSLPEGGRPDFYAELISLAHSAGIPAIVDTSGPGMLAAAEAGADLLKPNNHELLEATGERDVVAGAVKLMALGARRVLVSAGADGMMAFEAAQPDRYWHARLPFAFSGNPTGAGDASVAAAAVALCNGPTEIEHILRAATSWSAAAVLMPGAGEISPRHAELATMLIVTQKELS